MGTKPAVCPGQPGKYSGRTLAGEVLLKRVGRPTDNPSMRSLLEYLGILEPERQRREPVALPAWLPSVVSLLSILLLGAVSLMLWTAIRAFLG
jgi:hypothetical protein